MENEEVDCSQPWLIALNLFIQSIDCNLEFINAPTFLVFCATKRSFVFVHQQVIPPKMSKTPLLNFRGAPSLDSDDKTQPSGARGRLVGPTLRVRWTTAVDDDAFGEVGVF